MQGLSQLRAGMPLVLATAVFAFLKHFWYMGPISRLTLDEETTFLNDSKAAFKVARMFPCLVVDDEDFNAAF